MTWRYPTPMSESLVHRDGIGWWEAKLPFWIHRCKWQTYDKQDGEQVCACGARTYSQAYPYIWVGKNSRRLGRTSR